MTPLDGLPILTVAEMRAAEDAAIAAGATVESLMERAGAGVAEWTARLAGGSSVLVLCGPGNNGGDGYVAARVLAAQGVAVRVAAIAPPKTAAARTAAARWGGPVEAMSAAKGAPVVVDALFGTGAVRRPGDADHIGDLLSEGRLTIAVDLPSGLDADLGVAQEFTVPFDVTLALGALKPAHLLQPGATYCGHVRLVDLGLPEQRDPTIRVVAEPKLEAPNAFSHKYNRGRVTVIAGAMPGASVLCATAALRAGAGYVSLDGADRPGWPSALVLRDFDPTVLRAQADGVVVVGPGLGRDKVARARLSAALQTATWLVIDGDALRLIDPDELPWHCVLTPHSGEFDALFGAGAGSKIDRTRAAAARAGCVVVHKGADTVIAAPDGRVRVTPPGSHWLATAGAGDVLAGAIAARVAAPGGLADRATASRRWASGSDAIRQDMRCLMNAACDGVWMHGQAARVLGGGFIADDLVDALSVIQASAR